MTIQYIKNGFFCLFLITLLHHLAPVKIHAKVLYHVAKEQKISTYHTHNLDLLMYLLNILFSNHSLCVLANTGADMNPPVSQV